MILFRMLQKTDMAICLLFIDKQQTDDLIRVQTNILDKNRTVYVENDKFIK